MSKSPSRGRSASPFANPRVLLPIGLVVAVAGYFGFTWWKGVADAAAERRRLLDDTARELQQERPDDGALSKLMAGLKQQPDAKTAADLLAAQASIELWRGSVERAYELFGAVAARPEASNDELHLGARILMARQQGFTGEIAESATMLQQVITYTERAMDGSDDAADLLRCWQAAERGFDHARADGFAGQLAAGFAQTAEGRLVQLLRGVLATGEFGLSQLEALPPVATKVVERDAVHALGVLQAGRVEDAFQEISAQLLAAPGVWLVRHAAAITFLTKAVACQVPEERARLLARRDEQLDWLAARAPVDEPLRAKWTQMRAVR
ncbi:MAG: hypothetical protein H6835_06205 [Planctomycetes bacterium]|nr:hypothetical protein [Planctomycetota bacterium]